MDGGDVSEVGVAGEWDRSYCFGVCAHDRAKELRDGAVAKTSTSRRPVLSGGVCVPGKECFLAMFANLLLVG